jgi:DNA polymerase III subunit epsilon
MVQVKGTVLKKKDGAKKRAKTGEEAERTGRFAAIDFETADYGRDSACAVSVVVVDKSEIARCKHFLIRPPRRDFMFTHIHGITWRHVAKKPDFAGVWKDAAPLLDGVDFIAAHNASFDRSVLHACCEASGLDVPAVDFVCTVKLARYAWNIYPTALPDVCRKFRIPLKHHDALSDATACAKIVMEAIKKGIDPMIVLAKKKSSRAG